MNYTIDKQGKEYRIFCKQSRCYVLYFTRKREAMNKLHELNS